MVCLSEYARLCAAEKTLLQEIQRAEEAATRTTVTIDGMPHTKQIRSRVETGAVTIADLKAQHAAVTDQLQQMKAELEVMFTAVDDPDQRAILRLHYLNGHKIELIADAIGMTSRNAYRLFKEGKNELQSMFPERININ